MKDEPPALVSPRLLELPSDNVNVVYLDLSHWISLAQASVGHSKGSSFVETLQACHAARSAGTAMFVLSGTHYGEMLKIKDPAQRRDIANVMEELTGFATLVSRVVVMEFELMAVLDRYAKAPSLLPMIPLIGQGVRHAFGLESGLKIIGAVRGKKPTACESVSGQRCLMNSLLRRIWIWNDLYFEVPLTTIKSRRWLRSTGIPMLSCKWQRGGSAEERDQTLRLNGGAVAAGSVTRCCVSARVGNRIPEYPPAPLAKRGLALADCDFGSTIGSRVRSRDAEYRSLDRIEDYVAQKWEQGVDC